jgi:hypothetical protein
MERFKSKPPEDREKILYTIFGTMKESVGIKVVKAIEEIEKEGKRAKFSEICKKVNSPASVARYLPELIDLDVIKVEYSQPTKTGRKDTYYKVNKDYDWIIGLTE